MKKRLLLGVASVGYGKVVVTASQLGLVPVLAHSWGLPLYGHWLMLSAVPAFLAASDFGMSTAAGNRLLADVATGNHLEAQTTFQTAWAMILGSSMLVFLIALAVTISVPDSLLGVKGGMSAQDARAVLLLMSFYAVLALQGAVFMAAARSVGHFALSTTTEATIQLLETLAIILVVIKGGGPVQVAGCYVVLRMCGMAAHGRVAAQVASWLKPGVRTASVSRLKELARPALAAMLLPIAFATHLQGTALAVGAAVSPTAVPIYTSVRTLSRVGLQVVMALNLPIMPEFARAVSRRDFRKLARIEHLTLIVGLVLGAAYASVIFFLGNPLLALWTGGVIQAPPMMLLLVALATVAASYWGPFSNLILAVNRHELYTYAFLLLSAVTVLATYALSGEYDVTGAAFAAMVLDLGMALIVAVLYKRLSLSWKVENA